LYELLINVGGDINTVKEFFMSWNNKGRHYVFLGIIAILVFAFILGCSGGNRLSGTWKSTRDDGGIYGGMTLTFSGKNYTEKYRDGNIRRKGTYSIMDNKIEFDDSFGSIEVCSFSRTADAITIDGERFTRKK
jgi:hypothetical protein